MDQLKRGPFSEAEKGVIQTMHLQNKTLTEIAVETLRSEKSISKFLNIEKPTKKRGKKPSQKPVDVGVFVQLLPTTVLLPESKLKVSFDLPKDLSDNDVDVIFAHLRNLYPDGIDRAYNTFNKIKLMATELVEMPVISEEEAQANQDYEAIKEIEKSLMGWRRGDNGN